VAAPAAPKELWTADPTQLLRVGAGFSLSGTETDGHPGFNGKKALGASVLAAGAATLNGLQEQLYAASTVGDERRILLVLQAMDTAGKGGIVAHVVGAVNPDGVRYKGFKKPTDEELAHDFLWRVERALPGAGQIGVFDRSHYEDVLIGRVRKLASERELERRYGAINEFEKKLVESGTTIIKVMLNISSAEQKRRLTKRLHREDKYWKYNPADVDERLLWDDYQRAYDIVFERTSTDVAPWYVIPADKKWYSRLAVQRLLNTTLESFNLAWPEPDYDLYLERARVEAS
jgi:PPK2 family polyphosphate:nucleotide phosphotransferase